MLTQSKHERFTTDYALQFTILPTSISIQLITYSDYTVQKYTTNIQYLHTSPLLDQFGSPINLFQFLKDQNNYEYQHATLQFIMKWQIVAHHFCKDVTYKLQLTPALLTQIQHLKYENVLLKRRLMLYETQNNKNSPKKQKELKNVQTTQENHCSSDTVSNLQINISHQAQASKKITNHEEIIIDSHSQSFQYKEAKSLTLQKKNKPIRKQQKKSSIKCQNQNLDKKPKNSKKSNKNQSRVQQKEEKIKSQISKESNKIKISFANGDYYFGEVKNNLYHGHGLYYSLTNGTFQGIWENGKANGYGVSLDSYGNKHSGQYKNGSRNGKGIDEYINGEKYEGNFENDCKTGMGKYIYKNGDFYEGEWKNDMYNGSGKQTYHDGTSFEGNWSNDEKDGQGIFKDKEGKKWEQVWNKGAKISQQKLN